MTYYDVRLLWAAQKESVAMKKLGPKLEVSPATKRLWQELKQEMVSITTKYVVDPTRCFWSLWRRKRGKAARLMLSRSILFVEPKAKDT